MLNRSTQTRITSFSHGREMVVSRTRKRRWADPANDRLLPISALPSSGVRAKQLTLLFASPVGAYTARQSVLLYMQGNNAHGTASRRIRRRGKLWHIRDGGKSARAAENGVCPDHFSIAWKKIASGNLGSRTWPGNSAGRPIRWGMKQRPAAETRRIHFTGVAAGASDRDVLYTIDTDYALRTLPATRVRGRRTRTAAIPTASNSWPADLAPFTGHRRVVALSVRRAGWHRSHRHHGPRRGRASGRITEGDAVDEAPAWVPTQESRILLLFRSAGIGQHHQGDLHRAFRSYTDAADRPWKPRRCRSSSMRNAPTRFRISRMCARTGTLYFIRQMRISRSGRRRLLWRIVQKTPLLFPFRIWCWRSVHFF